MNKDIITVSERRDNTGDLTKLNKKVTQKCNNAYFNMFSFFTKLKIKQK